MDQHGEHLPSIEMGHLSDESHDLPEDLQHKLQMTLGKYKKAQPILDIADTFLKMPLSSMEHTLKNAITHAGDGVAQTFFNKFDAKFKINGKDFTSLRNDMAVCIMAKGLGQITKYGFNKTIKVSKANKKLQDLIHSKEGISLGRELMLQYLIDHHDFQEFLKYKEHWVKTLENVLLDEVYIIGTVVKEMTEKDNLPAKMKIFMLKEFGSKKVHDVLEKWEECSDAKTAKPVYDFIFNDNHLLDASSWMEDAFMDQIKAACYESSTNSWRPNTPAGPSSKYTDIIYGASVRAWLEMPHSAFRLNLRTGNFPHNIIRHKNDATTFSGFLRDTEVALANGDSIPIQHLRENDKILCNHGLVGTISSEVRDIILKDEVRVYGFNDEKPFFTSCQPFWTQRGWKAVDPHGAKEENPWLEVGQLSGGAHVRKIKSYRNDEVKYEWVELTDINSEKLEAGTYVYGLHTREGPRSLHVNGYLVYENYPEMTTRRVIENMANMSAHEQLTMTSHLKDLEPTLHKLIGGGPAKAMAAISQKHVDYQLNNGNKIDKHVPLKEVCLSKVSLHYHSGKTKHEEYKMPQSLALMRGHLFIDGKHVGHSHISKEDHVTWTRPVSTNKWEHGTVKLHHGRLSGHGFVALTKNHADTKSLASADFTAAVNKNTYKCYKSVKPETDGTSTISKWEDFGGLIMGTDFSSGECKTIGKIKIPPAMDEYYDFGNSVTFTSDDKYQLHVNVNLTADWRSVIGYCKLTGVFSADFSSFSGSCVQYDVTAPGYEGKTYAWKGIIEKNPETVSMLKTVKMKNMHKAVHYEKKSLKTFDAVDSSTSKPKTAMARTTSDLTDASLSLDDLYMLTPPNMDAVHTLTFSYLQQGMKYEMDDENRENILGVERPTPSGQLASVCDKYKTFLGTRFANAYCMYGLSQSSHFDKTITEEERNKLLFYFNGSDKGCLAADADYNNANNEFSRVAFLECLPALEKYLKSSHGGGYWAKKLYNRLTQQRILNGMAAQAQSAQTLAIIQKQSMVLFCLAPDQDYGSQFYKKILTTKLNQMSSFFQGDSSTADVMKEVFQDSINQLVLQILSQSDKTSGEATKQLQKTLAEAMKELNIAATASAKETASAIVSHMENIVSSCITAMSSKTGNSWDALISSLNEAFGDRNKMKAFGYLAGSLLFQAMWGASLVFTIKMFMQWKHLKPEQQVALCVDLAQMTLDVFNKVPSILKGIQDCIAKKKVTFKFMEIWQEGNAEPEMNDLLKIIMKTGIEDEEGGAVSPALFNEEIVVAATSTANELEESASGWSRLYAITGEMSKSFGLACSLAGCVVIGFQIGRDFKKGAPVAQKALDICQGVCLAVAATASAAGILLDMACIPMIGIICAIGGIGFAIASMFIKRDPPKPKPTKIDKYVKRQGKPTLAKFPAPSDEWVKNYRNKESE